MIGTLVVFDYDWSLVNDNSDTLVFKALCPDLLEEISTRRLTETSWTKLMDDLLGELVTRVPSLTRAQILDAVARIPVQPRMLDALRMAINVHGADVVIISDANTVYIDSMLELHGLQPFVSEIFTNPAAFNGDSSNRLRVEPFHSLQDEPHGCELCPTNMCKGRILDSIRAKKQYDVVLYVGDGGGDFCPSTRLTNHDVVFAREDDENGKPFGLLKKIRSNAEKVCANVVPWRTGEDIYEEFSNFLHGGHIKRM